MVSFGLLHTHRALLACVMIGLVCGVLASGSYAGVQGPVAAQPGRCHNLVAYGPNGDSRTVNLDELSTLTAIKPLTAVDKGAGVEYNFGVCQDIPCTSKSPDSAGCVVTPAPYSFSLGPFAEYNMRANLTTNFQGSMVFVNGAIQINNPQFGYRHMLLTIICDYNAIEPSNIFAISPELSSTPPWTYQMFVTHRSACGVR